MGFQRRISLKARFLLPSLVLLMALPTVTAAADDDDDRGVLAGFGGTVIYENSLGRGTFSSTATSDIVESDPDFALWNMSLSIRPNFTISKINKLKAHLRLDLNTNVIEDSTSTNRVPHDVQLGDVRLYVTWGDFLKIDPAFLSFSGSATLYLPTSLLARNLTNLILSSRLAITTKFAPTDWVSFSYNFGAKKNFNKFENMTVDFGTFVDQNGLPAGLPTRAGGAEAVAELTAATGVINTEWVLNHSLSLGFSYAKFSLGFDWVYYQLFKYGSFDKDANSSPHAVAGTGYNDIMYGYIDLGYSITDNLSIALGTVTEQTPKTSDNQDFRFPFWDTTNGSDNRQTFYFDVTGTF